MARYFFTVYDGRDFPDEEGSEFPDLASVRNEAIAAAGEMIREGGRPDLWSGQDWRMVVTDEAGLEVLTLTLSARQPGFQGTRTMHSIRP